jgi:uncharacterized protein YcbK (DUF882 family)
MTQRVLPSRRIILSGASASIGLALLPLKVSARVVNETKALAFHNLNSGEKLHVTYFARGAYNPAALEQVTWLFRDLRSGETHDIDVKLLDLLFALKKKTASESDFHIMSGYRSPATNAALRRQDRDVDPHSLHMQGQAVDVIQDFDALDSLWQAAKALKAGGVGYYPAFHYVHLDVGPLRHWRACSDRSAKAENDPSTISGCFTEGESGKAAPRIRARG